MDGKLRNLTDFFYSKGREEFPLLKYFKGTSEDRKKQKTKQKTCILIISQSLLVQNNWDNKFQNKGHDHVLSSAQTRIMFYSA